MNSAYLSAVESIHAPQTAVENAIAAAKARAAKRLSAQANIRYAAMAAGVVFAAAGAVYLSTGGGKVPPVKPPYTASASAPTESTEASTLSLGTEAMTESAAEAATQTAPTESIRETVVSETVISETQVQESPTQPFENAAEPTQTPTEKPAERPTEPYIPDETEPEYVEVMPIDVEVDRSQLGSDGKLYCMIAETGYNIADDPTAFSDDHVYYVETKFGRFKQPISPWYVDSSEMRGMSYIFYNSDGVVLYSEPLMPN